ncbi:MAG: alpha/beta hydrolase [Balneolales bacterium]|nr:alpha/beta hydrolase [Balneolales bacterium]
MNSVTTFFAVAVGLYLAACAFLYFFQNQLIFLPSSEIVQTPLDAGMEFTEHFFETENGLKLHGWFIPASGSHDKHPTIIFCHGNAGNISGRIPIIRQFHSIDANVFIFDYQGYGQSEGRTGERQVLADGLAAWDFVTKELGIPEHTILPVGRSMGGPVAAHMALNRNATALAIESTFTSIPDIALKTYPIFPVRLLARINLPTLEFVEAFGGPILVAHSAADRLIPYEMGRTLYESAGERGRWLELQGGHNDGHIATGPKYANTYADFIQDVFRIQEQTPEPEQGL